MSFTNYMEKKVLDHVFGGVDYTRPLTIEIGLSTTEINEDGTNITEPDVEDGYSQVQIDNDSDAWEDAETISEVGVKKNKIDIEFPEATGDWGLITHFFISDGTNIIGFGELTNGKEIGSGDIAKFRAGELQIKLD